MPRLKTDFPATEPAAVGNYSIDFALNVPPGTTLVSAAWALAIHQRYPGGSLDGALSAHLIGAPQVQGTVSVQTIAALLPGNDYLVTVTGTMSDGEVVVLWTVLPCRAPQ